MALNHETYSRIGKRWCETMAEWVRAAATALENSRDACVAGFQAWFGVV
jgi:hypothetical protein